MRYVVRPPSIYTTPSLIKRTLGCVRTVTAGNSYRPIDWRRDFFLHYPDPSEVLNTDARYEDIRSFTGSTKLEQRRALTSAGIPTPASYSSYDDLLEHLGRADVSILESVSTPLVRRPLRHSQGVGYAIIHDPYDWDPTKEYVSELYPKAHEYRIIFCLGTPVITLYKRVPDDVDPNGPWNHACGSSFVTVNNPELNRLRHTDAYDRLSSMAVIKHAHLCAADIMLAKKGQYVVSELNFCPALTIPSNLERIKLHVQAHSELRRLAA